MWKMPVMNLLPQTWPLKEQEGALEELGVGLEKLVGDLQADHWLFHLYSHMGFRCDVKGVSG